MIVKLFEKLKCHEFDIMHIAGEENVIADALSRLDEPISFAVSTLEHVVRDKRSPTIITRRTISLKRRTHSATSASRPYFKSYGLMVGGGKTSERILLPHYQPVYHA